MLEIAEFYGFIFRSSCRCGGVPTKNYTKTVNDRRYDLKIMYMSNKWALRCQNTIIARGNESDLISKLTIHELI